MHSLCPPSTVTRPILAQAFSLPNHAVHLQNHPRSISDLPNIPLHLFPRDTAHSPEPSRLSSPPTFPMMNPQAQPGYGQHIEWVQRSSRSALVDASDALGKREICIAEVMKGLPLTEGSAPSL